MSFWTASAAVFLGNAALSVAGSRWMLAALQVMTATLAVLAAVDEWDAKRQSRPRPRGEAGFDLPGTSVASRNSGSSV